MELIDDLNEEIWSRGDPNSTEGYSEYRLMKCEKQPTKDKYIYAVFDPEGFLRKVLLDGGAGYRDPLSGISLLSLRLSADEKLIEGIIVEDECVQLKSLCTPEPEPEPEPEADSVITNGDAPCESGEKEADGNEADAKDSEDNSNPQGDDEATAENGTTAADSNANIPDVQQSEVTPAEESPA